MKIAICGKMCSGKSTLARELQKIYPNCEIMSFADKIKEIAKDLFDMRGKDRKLLQQIGSSMRIININVWTNYLLNKKKDNIIIDDLRYFNEADALKNNGFIIIRINVSDKLQKERIIKKYPLDWESHYINRNHDSEIYINKLDKYIDIDLDSDEGYNVNQMSVLLNKVRT